MSWQWIRASLDVYAGAADRTGKSCTGQRTRRNLVDITVEEMGDSVRSIAIDPSDHQTVYVGTSQHGPVFKSTDGGETWVEAARGIPNFAGRPALPWILRIKRGVGGDEFTSHTLYRSTDGGRMVADSRGLILRSVKDLAVQPSRHATFVRRPPR